MHRRLALGLVLVVIFAMTGRVSLAEFDLRLPDGPVLLRVSGDIAVTNAGDEAHFDWQMLEDLGFETISTRTVWTNGLQEFTGVPLVRLLMALGVSGAGEMTARAVNDYHIDIPFSDAVEGGPIIAMLRNGEPMSLRDKGPLWVIYPYDSDPAYRNQVIYARSIWQLLSIEVGS